MYKHGMQSDVVDAIARSQEFDLVIYLEPDVVWVDDGYRFSGTDEERKNNNEKLKYMFGKYDIECIMISGDYEKRFEKACELVDDLME
jgi:HTH-type transcriptional repressor of NAD biosynthesis genes